MQCSIAPSFQVSQLWSRNHAILQQQVIQDPGEIGEGKLHTSKSMALPGYVYYVVLQVTELFIGTKSLPPCYYWMT